MQDTSLHRFSQTLHFAYFTNLGPSADLRNKWYCSITERGERKMKSSAHGDQSSQPIGVHSFEKASHINEESSLVLQVSVDAI